MEIITFDFDDSLENLNTFKQQTIDTFDELIATAASAAQIMSEQFLSFAERTNLAFYETSLGIKESFDTAFFAIEEGFAGALSGMVESAAVLCEELIAGFTETWSGINESTVALWETLNAGFTETWNSISGSTAVFLSELEAAFTDAWNSISGNTAIFLAGLEAGFAETWNSISQSTAEFLAEMDSGFTTLCMDIENGFNELWAFIENSTDGLYNFINESSINLWTGLDHGFNQSWTSIREGTDSLWQSIKTSANELWTGLTEGFTNLWHTIDGRFKGLWSSIRDANASLWKDTDKGFSDSIEKVKNNFTGMWEQVRLGNDSLWSTAETDVEELIRGIYTDFDKLRKDIPQKMQDMANEVTGIVSRLTAWLTNSINTIISGINKVPMVNIPTIPQPTPPPTFAQGGFPNQGQMFIAREAGPELVGTIGSHSAVVNNNQIVESVSRGVYDAVTAAMSGRSGSSSSAPQEFNLYLDSKQITASVERVQEERGLSILGGRTSFGF